MVRSPTLRAVGLTVLMDRPSEPKEVTCILCQADTKDFTSEEKVFVQAVCVQRSCVLRRGDCSDVKELGTSKTISPCPLSCKLYVFMIYCATPLIKTPEMRPFTVPNACTHVCIHVYTYILCQIMTICLPELTTL